MPIRQMLNNAATVLLRSVFEDTLRALNLSDRTDPITTLVAKKIIELATSHGELDASRLRQAAINSFYQAVEKLRREVEAPRHGPKSTTSSEIIFVYGVSVSGSDWRWELMLGSHVVGRGVARTQSRAYADALSAALAPGVAPARGRSSGECSGNRSDHVSQQRNDPERALAARRYCGLCQSPRRLLSHLHRHLANPPTALQKAFKIIAEHFALGSKQLLRRSTAHQSVYPLQVSV
jgi:hypothetical protein